MPLDLEEEVSAATVTGNTVTVTTASELHNLCAFIRGHFVGGLDSGGSCHCSSAGPPGSGLVESTSSGTSRGKMEPYNHISWRHQM